RCLPGVSPGELAHHGHAAVAAGAGVRRLAGCARLSQPAPARIVTTELGRLIARRIALAGPISMADFMAEALGHPRLGYYRGALPVGAAGDFTTAPEISQMFGEMVGAWLAERWLAMGRPTGVR